MMHAGAAVKLNTSTLLLSEDQADQLTRAGAEVAKHYNIAMLDPKWMAWIAFGGVAAKVYGGMVLGYMNERQAGNAVPSPYLNGAANPAGPPAAQPQTAQPVIPVPYASGAIIGNA